MNVKKHKTLILGGSIVGALLATGAWYYFEFMGAGNRPFVLIKDWRHNSKEVTEFSEGAQWVHHQCHEPVMTRSPLGHPIALSAKEVTQRDAKTWEFTINSAAKFSDGTPVLAEHFVKAWNYRKNQIKAPSFRRIDSIKSLDTHRVEVVLTDFSSHDLVLEALTSMWITPLKDPKGLWSWDVEISGPCEGPFVPSMTAFDTLSLTRNKYWRDFDRSLLRRVSVIAGVGSRETASDLFQAGKISYVDSSIDPNLKSDFSGKRNSFLEAAAWYVLINPYGAFSKKFTVFPHYVMNRGDLESVVSGNRFFKVMYGLLPLSFVDSNGKPMYGSFLVSGPESILDARRNLGFSEKATVAEIKPPFKKIVIYGVNDEKITPVMQRFADRLKSNFNVDSEMIRELPAEKKEIDLAFVKINLAMNLNNWAQEMMNQYEEIFPMPKETKSQFDLLSKIASQPSVEGQQTAILQKLDNMPLEQNTIIPIGQFASAFLLSPSVVGVQVRGDARQDPDIGHAKWVLEAK